MNVAADTKSLNLKKILLVIVVLAIGGYQWYVQNSGHEQVDVDGVAVVDSTDSAPSTPPAGPLNSAKNGEANEDRATDEFLVSVGGRNLQSPAGLIYGMGGGGEHRVEHVMRHGRDDVSRPAHGVFEGDQDTILKLIDEAYGLVKSKSKYVKTEKSQGNTAYTISMGRKVGYEGGEKGKRNGNRDLKSIRLVLDGDRVITAYPYR